MNTSEYTNIYKHEGDHFYYVCLHRLILGLAARYLVKSRNIRLLDAGCGTGLLGIRLKSFGLAEGIDINVNAIKYSRKRGLKVYKASLERLPQKNDSYDFITCIDVLYHEQIHDDTIALKELYRILKPGGILIVRVPALELFRRVHDNVVHTRSRYNITEFRNKLISAGFFIKRLTYMHSVLVPFALFERAIEAVGKPKNSRSDVGVVPKWVNMIMKTLLFVENQALRYVDLPIGLGLIAVVIKSKKILAKHHV